MEARNGRDMPTRTTSATLCSVYPGVSCTLGFQPAYATWATSIDDGIDPIATTHMFIDAEGLTTSSSVDCNWSAVSSSYGAEYSVDGDCNLVAELLFEDGYVTDGINPDTTITITYPSTVAVLGSAYDVSSFSVSDGSCINKYSVFRTTDIYYTGRLSANTPESRLPTAWDFPDLTEYLPGVAAATECSIVFATVPNTLTPANYLTVYNRASATLTASGRMATDVQISIAATDLSDDHHTRSSPAVIGGQTLSTGTAVTVTTGGLAQVVSVLQASDDEEPSSVLVVSGTQTITTDLADYLCSAGQACAAETIDSVAVGSNKPTSSTSTSGGIKAPIGLQGLLILVLAISTAHL